MICNVRFDFWSRHPGFFLPSEATFMLSEDSEVGEELFLGQRRTSQAYGNPIESKQVIPCHEAACHFPRWGPDLQLERQTSKLNESQQPAFFHLPTEQWLNWGWRDSGPGLRKIQGSEFT